MDKTIRRGVLRRTSIMLGMGMAALAWVKWIQAHELLLTTVAHPVTNVNAETEHVCWLSDHQLLITTTQSVPVGKKAPQSAPLPKNWRDSIDLLDTPTHQRGHLSALTDLLNRTQSAPLQGTDRFTVSPDGTWLLWNTHTKETELPWLHAAHLDGSNFRTWELGPYPEQHFLDTRHLMVEYDSTLMSATEGIVIIRDLQDPTKDQTISGRKQQQAVFARCAARSPFVIKVNGYVSLARGAKEAPEIVTYRMQDYLLYSPPNTLPPIHRQLVTLPQDAKFLAAYVSPQQSFIVYRLMVSRTFPLFDWLHRVFSSFSISPTQTQELWVSHVDGSGMREVGHEPFTIDSEIDPNARIEDIHWLPDGKRISFAYGGMFYVASVEPKK